MGMKLIFTQNALDDIDGIRAHTLNSWGQKQLAKYTALLGEQMLAIMNNPSIGKLRKDMPANVRVSAAGKHRIFYVTEGKAIHILRILHEKMDAVRHV